MVVRYLWMQAVGRAMPVVIPPRLCGQIPHRRGDLLLRLGVSATVFFLFAACCFGAVVTTTAVPILVTAGGASTVGRLMMAVDAAGYIYVAGNGQSNVTATPGAFQSQPAKDPRACPNPLLFDGSCMTPFVAKLDPTGTKIIYLTYVSGNYTDYISSMAVDARGSVYVAGWTDSTNFPTTANSLHRLSPPGWPAFVVKLNPSGSAMEYGALFSGSQGQVVSALTLDPDGNAYVIGWTESTDFPVTPGAFQPYPGPGAYGETGFIVKLNASGSDFVYGSYIAALPRGIAADSTGQAYVTGQGYGRLATTAGALQSAVAGQSDAFVMKISTGGQLVYSTYVGGPAIDAGYGIAVDADGSAYVTGDTRADDLNPSITQPQFPVTPGAFQTVFDGSFDSGHRSAAVVFRLTPDGSSLVYSTYLTGDNFDSGHDIQVTSQGDAIVVGGGQSINFPTTHDAYISITNSIFINRSFLVRLDNTGHTLKYGTYLPGDARLAAGSHSGLVYAMADESDGSPLIARVDFSSEPASPFVGGVGNAASYQGGIIVPGELVTLFGTGIGPSPGVRASGFLGAIGTSTGGVQVLFDDLPAPVLYAASDQIIAQTPFEIAGRSTVEVKVRYAGGESNALPLQVTDALPGIFAVNSRGSGQAAVLNQDGTINSPANPAARGSIVSLFLTGGGVTNPPSATGRITPVFERHVLAEPAYVGFQTPMTAQVTYAGAAPGMISGMVQINAQIPPDAPVGDAIAVGVSIGTNPLQNFQFGLTVAIR